MRPPARAVRPQRWRCPEGALSPVPPSSESPAQRESPQSRTRGWPLWWCEGPVRTPPLGTDCGRWKSAAQAEGTPGQLAWPAGRIRSAPGRRRQPRPERLPKSRAAPLGRGTAAFPKRSATAAGLWQRRPARGLAPAPSEPLWRAAVRTAPPRPGGRQRQTPLGSRGSAGACSASRRAQTPAGGPWPRSRPPLRPGACHTQPRRPRPRRGQRHPRRRSHSTGHRRHPRRRRHHPRRCRRRCRRSHYHCSQPRSRLQPPRQPACRAAVKLLRPAGPRPRRPRWRRPGRFRSRPVAGTCRARPRRPSPPPRQTQHPSP
mmetsp:Transcript_4851/g.20796  ORF Transcript_4851/g.20796 Transcript_4851/m.20796 type:complete len:316 (-) Transcript_4851:749-1696(-)